MPLPTHHKYELCWYRAIGAFWLELANQIAREMGVVGSPFHLTYGGTTIPEKVKVQGSDAGWEWYFPWADIYEERHLEQFIEAVEGAVKVILATPPGPKRCIDCGALISECECN